LPGPWRPPDPPGNRGLIQLGHAVCNWGLLAPVTGCELGCRRTLAIARVVSAGCWSSFLILLGGTRAGGWCVCRPGCHPLVYSVLRWVGTPSVVVVVRLCW